MLMNVDYDDVIKRVQEQIEEEERLNFEFKTMDSSGTSTGDTHCGDSLLHSNETIPYLSAQDVHHTSDDGQTSSYYESLHSSFEN